MNIIVKQPLLTEKSMLLARSGWFTFACSASADKGQIAAEVGKLYGVTVTDIRTVTMHGKTRRVGRRQTVIRKSDWKKALVRLSEGQKIDAFDVPTEAPKG